MAGGNYDENVSYSRVITFVFVFNLIVGTGALAIPKAFQEAGWLMASIVVSLLAFVSYITATFVIETMSIANGISRLKSEGTDSIEPIFEDSVRQMNSIQRNETTPLIVSNSYSEPEKPFEITKKYDLSELAAMFYPSFGLVLFYVSMCIYLFGDLAVYSAVVAKSLRDVICTFSFNESNADNVTALWTMRSLEDGDPCWPNSGINRGQAYLIFLGAFMLVLGPFAFFTVSKTKYLQLMTTLLRWTAFISMFVLTLIALLSKRNDDDHSPFPKPKLVSLTNIPALFGVCVYAFMCHHSLPGMITPLRNKNRIHFLLLVDYILILFFYLFLALTAVFTFNTIQDLYTLNFQPNDGNKESVPIPDIPFLEYFLALFPVFTLSTNYPIIAITLRDNLKTLVKNVRNLLLTHGRDELTLLPDGNQPLLSDLPKWIDRGVFPLVAILPPTLIAIATNNVTTLVGYTGAYAGAAIQYVIPACLVWFARKRFSANFHSGLVSQLGVHRSPFRHSIWILLILIWTVASISLVTIYLFTKKS